MQGQIKGMRVGVIGCGQIAKTHLPFILSYPDRPAVAVADTNEEILKDTAEAFGISKRYLSVKELLSGFQPHVVHVLTPPQSHYPLCLEAIEAGCHVFVEKPMCVDLAQAEALAARATAAGVKLCVDHNHKFDPAMLQARGWIEQGAVGTLCSMESYYGFDLGSDPRSRYYREAYTHWAYRTPGGLFQNLIDHALYPVLDYLPDPDRITAVSHECGVTPGEVPDELRVLMANGSCSAFVSVSLAASPRFHYFNVYGTRASIHVDLINQYAYLYKKRKGPGAITRALSNVESAKVLVHSTLRNMGRVVRGKFTVYPGTQTIIHRFYDAVLNDTEPPVTLQQALKVVEIGDIIWKQIDYPQF
jgi:predicted dehydrogenase